MSSERDIEKLAREIVATVLEPIVLRGQCGVRHEDELTFCVYDVPCPIHGNHSVTARMAIAFLAERQRADDLAKRERKLRGLVAQGQRAIRALGAGDMRCYDQMEAFVKKADTLLAKEPQ